MVFTVITRIYDKKFRLKKSDVAVLSSSIEQNKLLKPSLKPPQPDYTLYILYAMYMTSVAFDYTLYGYKSNNTFHHTGTMRIQV